VLKDTIGYDAWGNITSETASGWGGLYKWTGRQVDQETGCQYNRARFYDPNTGRWTSQDPLGFDAGDSNLYRYVQNNATNASDPTGCQERLPLPVLSLDRTSPPDTFNHQGTGISLSEETQQWLRALVVPLGKGESLEGTVEVRKGKGLGTGDENITLNVNILNVMSKNKNLIAEPVKDFHWVQFVQQYALDSDGAEVTGLPPLPVIIGPRSLGAKFLNKTDYYLDSVDPSRFYYGAGGGYQRGKSDLAIIDHPTMAGYILLFRRALEAKKVAQLVQAYDTLLLYKDKVVYHIHWERRYNVPFALRVADAVAENAAAMKNELEPGEVVPLMVRLTWSYSTYTNIVGDTAVPPGLQTQIRNGKVLAYYQPQAGGGGLLGLFTSWLPQFVESPIGN
jgi:RHS repeat-associated protein